MAAFRETCRGVPKARLKARADVYLVALRPFLGEDIAGRLRLKKSTVELGSICLAFCDPKGHEGSYVARQSSP